jgi:hypothetical protein
MKPISKIFLILLITLSFNSFTNAQTNNSPCSSPEAAQFDFWLGSWNLEWKNEKGETEKGTNTITKTLGGCVIEENFSNAGNLFSGKSVSVYNTNKKLWQQTWVDNSGGYLDFTGGLDDGKMILSRRGVNRLGKEVMQRMVWYDVSENELYWNWESSSDNGQTWKTLWKIHYTKIS